MSAIGGSSSNISAGYLCAHCQLPVHWSRHGWVHASTQYRLCGWPVQTARPALSTRAGQDRRAAA
jgi:hypothetical protein